MSTSVPGPAWQARTVAFLGIVLAALNLRIGVAAVAPVLHLVRDDVPFSATQGGLLGAVPVVAFSLSGALSPLVARRLGLEATLVVALALAAVGEVARSAAVTAPAFLGWSMVALGGMGMGNVLLPPLVKRYFADRVGMVTAAYSVAMVVSTALPPLAAVPAARLLGWRTSLAMWALLSVLGAVPWLVVLVRSGRAGARLRRTVAGMRRRTTRPAGAPTRPRPAGRVWRSPLAWGMALTFGVNTGNAYSLLAWLPQMLAEAGVPAITGGRMLALFAVLGLPPALLAPMLAVRVRNPWLLVVAFVVCFVGGYLGLLLSPTEPLVLWVLLLGLGPGAFPLVLTLINLRTRTPAGTAALSGFTQGIGYALGGIGPVLVGTVYAATGSFRPVYVGLISSMVLLLAASAVACRPVVLEDGWGRPEPVAAAR